MGRAAGRLADEIVSGAGGAGMALGVADEIAAGRLADEIAGGAAGKLADKIVGGAAGVGVGETAGRLADKIVGGAAGVGMGGVTGDSVASLVTSFWAGCESCTSVTRATGRRGLWCRGVLYKY